ncbi:Cof-type HAD-IIB family hydrolase [bacterium]|nr:Cof-type HAD-IIB family hydrolase [bacterium]
MTELKVCYFDIDGTLVGKNGAISQDVLAAIRDLHRRGILVGVASGRPWFSACEIATQIETTAPCMTFSGAFINERKSGTVHYESPLSAADAGQVVALAEEHGWYLELYDRSQYYVSQRTEISDIHTEYMETPPEEARLSEVLSKGSEHPIVKSVFAFQGEIPAGALEEISARTENTAIAVAYGAAHPDLHFVNVVDQAADRSVALKRLCALLDCSPEQMMAFGDGESDIPFLSQVQWGVAMGNAKECVQEAASHVAPSVEESGIAGFLESFFSE